MACQINGNYNLKNIEILADQIITKYKTKQKKINELFVCETGHTLLRMSSNNHAAVYIDEKWGA